MHVKISSISSEVGCRYQKLKALQGGLRACNNLLQPPKTEMYREGVAEDSYMLSILLTVSSCFNSGIPTFYTCFTHFFEP